MKMKVKNYENGFWPMVFGEWIKLKSVSKIKNFRKENVIGNGA